MKPQVLTMTRSAAAIARRDFVALGAQAREDALRVDERLGAAQTDEAHFGGLSDGLFQEVSTLA